MRKSYYMALFVLLGAIFFIPFLGSTPLFDWDEINFAESAREMLLSGNYTRVQINYHPFWEKPPLFFWLQALSMHLFGVNEFAARLPNALFGIITLLTLFLVGRRWHDNRFGSWWALAYWGSFLPHFYFKSGIIDPVFNYFIFAGIICLIEALHINTLEHTLAKSNARYLLLAGIFAGLAVLTKGPVGFLLIALTTVSVCGVLLWQHKSNLQQFGKILPDVSSILLFARACGLFLLPMLLVSSLWFGIEMLQNGPDVLVKFIQYQIRLFATPDAGHQQPFFYHWVVVLIGCFPMSLAALSVFFNQNRFAATTAQQLLRLWMICLFLVVLILFTLVKTKIVHYSSLSYLPLSYLAARYIYQNTEEKEAVKKYVQVALLLSGVFFALLLTAVPLAGMYKSVLAPFIKDPFARACLSVPVKWNGWEFLPGLLYTAVVVYVAGWQIRVKPDIAWRNLFIATAICILVFTPLVAPKIEQYSQGTVINFYKSMQGKDVYIEPVGFKSYAHFFYFAIPPNHCPPQYSDEWLLEGDIDKPAYLITKITKVKLFENYPDIQLLKKEGGFAFFVRYPKP